MEDQDTAAIREDDHGEELPEPPAPDPEDKQQPHPEDDPEAD